MSGASKTIICKKFAKSELDDVTREPEDWINKLELLRGNLRKLGVMIDDVEVMTHILSNIPEDYENIFQNLEYKLDYGIDMLTIERIWDKLSDKYDRMNVPSNQNKGKKRKRRYA